MTASAGSIRALRLLRYSAFSATLIGLSRMRNFAIAATSRTAAESHQQADCESVHSPLLCNLYVTCNLHVTRESSGVCGGESCGR